MLLLFFFFHCIQINRLYCILYLYLFCNLRVKYNWLIYPIKQNATTNSAKSSYNNIKIDKYSNLAYEKVNKVNSED